MMKTIAFHKYHGLGNDFIVVDAKAVHPDAQWAQRACDRHFGVGADGVLFVDANATPPTLVILNQDGSRPQMCGNGVRCVARYLKDVHGQPRSLEISTDAGLRHCEVFDDGSVEVDMGAARIDGQITYAGYTWWLVNMGNPHAVCFVDELPEVSQIDALGAQANADRAVFKEGINLEFAQVHGAHIDVIVFERGVGRTLACGTGACATAAAARQAALVRDGIVTVNLPGGPLQIEERAGKVWMTGGANLVYQGALDPGVFRNRDKEVV